MEQHFTSVDFILIYYNVRIPVLQFTGFKILKIILLEYFQKDHFQIIFIASMLYLNPFFVTLK